MPCNQNIVQEIDSVLWGIPPSHQLTHEHAWCLFLQLNFSEHSYFENILENLRAGAQKSLRKLRERVDQDM